MNVTSESTLWNNVATGAGGKSPAFNVGTRVNLAIVIRVSGATTIGIECAAGDSSAGRNDAAALVDNDFASLFKADGSGALTLVFAGAGAATLNLSPFAPQYLRLTSTNNITATAKIDLTG
jgi:hypothetical protein